MYKLRMRTPAIAIGGQAEGLYLPIQGGYRFLRHMDRTQALTGVADGLLKAVECMDTGRPPPANKVEVALVVVVVAEMTYVPVTRRKM